MEVIYLDKSKDDSSFERYKVSNDINELFVNRPGFVEFKNPTIPPVKFAGYMENNKSILHSSETYLYSTFIKKYIHKSNWKKFIEKTQHELQEAYYKKLLEEDIQRGKKSIEEMQSNDYFPVERLYEIFGYKDPCPDKSKWDEKALRKREKEKSKINLSDFIFGRRYITNKEWVYVYQYENKLYS